jgi:ribitol-5-phosphate 2-dehydrogenase (NADP+) / D-ribitol-5-phosphate cytidylyltransferase
MTSAIILAGGKGERFGGNKCFVSLNGKPVIDYCLSVIEPLVDEVIIVAPAPYKTYKHALPGPTRGQSVLNGLKTASGDKILIHEAVRPFVSPKIVSDVLKALETNLSVDTAVPVVDGLLWRDNPLSKTDYFISQTPEAFDTATLLDAFQKSNVEYQDEVTMMADVLGIKPKVVQGVFINSKITFPNDLPNAEGILKFVQRPIQNTPDLKGKTVVVYGRGDVATACLELLSEAGANTLQFTRENWYDVPEADGYIYAAGNYTDAIMEINFEVPLDLLNRIQSGNVVFLSSTAATYGRKEALYSASKAALNSLIESKHEELAKGGVYVNAIAPARIKGRLQAHFSPGKDQIDFLGPKEVAQWCLKYLDTKEHGHIIYLRNK